MKKLILAITLVIFTVSVTQAADQVITITIPSLVRRHETKPIMENAHTQIGDIVDPEIN